MNPGLELLFACYRFPRQLSPFINDGTMSLVDVFYASIWREYVKYSW